MSEMVTVPKEEYLELKMCEAELTALRVAGVDNWAGYSYIHKLFIWNGLSLQEEIERLSAEIKDM